MKPALKSAVALVAVAVGWNLPGCSSQPAQSGSAAPAPADSKGAKDSGQGSASAQAPTADGAKQGDSKGAAAADSKASELPPPPVDVAAVLPAIIKGFQSSYSVEVFAAAEQFRQLPADARRNVLAQLSAHDSDSVRHNAWRAFAAWATRDDVPTLVAALDSPHEEVRTAALDLLARFPNDDTIGVLTLKLQDPNLRERAEVLLIRVGPAAEGALLDFASHSDAGLRSAAWRVLAQIGTRKSLLALGQLATQPQFQKDADLQAALAKIRERLRK